MLHNLIFSIIQISIANFSLAICYISLIKIILLTKKFVSKKVTKYYFYKGEIQETVEKENEFRCHKHLKTQKVEKASNSGTLV